MQTTPKLSPPRKGSISRADYRWFLCRCGARVPAWGSMPAPHHCGAECVPCDGDGGETHRGCACGATFPIRSGKRGRPREHCSRECGQLQAAISVLDSHLTPIAKRATPEAWLALRSRVHSLTAGRPWNLGICRKG